MVDNCLENGNIAANHQPYYKKKTCFTNLDLDSFCFVHTPALSTACRYTLRKEGSKVWDSVRRAGVEGEGVEGEGVEREVVMG